MRPPRPAVFLDRDGTLVREVDYLADPGRLELLPGTGEALRLLAGGGFALIVVTNQSGIARGLLDEGVLGGVHERLRELLGAEGVRLDRIDYCPHHPSEGVAPWRVACDCRKPRPGMLVRAIAALGLDCGASWSVGDAERDVLAGATLGIPGVLVATGKGGGEYARLVREGRAFARFVPDVLAAARVILAGR